MHLLKLLPLMRHRSLTSLITNSLRQPTFSPLSHSCVIFQVTGLVDAVVVSDGGNKDINDTRDKKEGDGDEGIMSETNMIVWGTVLAVLVVALAFGAWFARCAARAQREARETGIPPHLLGGPNPTSNPGVAEMPSQRYYGQQQQHHLQYPPQQYGGFDMHHGQPVQGIPICPGAPVQHFQVTVQAPQAPKPPPPIQ
jgi:hypothetical protein